MTTFEFYYGIEETSGKININKFKVMEDNREDFLGELLILQKKYEHQS